ncbi:MAG: DUF2523 family protein [Vagococcus sp.]|jgi:hypothetical protein
MPAILIRLAVWMMSSFAGQLMFSMGLGFISYTAISTLISWIIERVQWYFVGASEQILIWIHIFELDYCVSVLISAFLIRASIMSAQVALTKRS